MGRRRCAWAAGLLLLARLAPAAGDPAFEATVTRLSAASADLRVRQQALLAARYDLSARPSPDRFMAPGKPMQQGVRVRLKPGSTWTSLAAMEPAEVRRLGLWPGGFLPLPHPHHEEGGMVFPQPLIDETLRQTGRDLTRFDLQLDLPQHLLPPFPPALYLTTRPDLGDVSQGRLITLDDYHGLFAAILNPKQLEGLRLLVTPFPQAQFNATDERRSRRPHLGVACFDCHANGHTDAATHLSGDARPNAYRHRIDTPTLRGLYAQQVFGSQRGLHSVEDFTEFEQRGAYFDGDPEQAQRKGVNVLERGSQVQAMAEMQSILDFPPAPSLDVLGRLRPGSASAAQLRGERLFNGKAECFRCHQAPYFTDNSAHDLKAERFFLPSEANGVAAVGDGPMKTMALRGVRESPPYLHDGRLLTLEDAVEYFNLILGLRLAPGEKRDLVSYLSAL